MMIRGTRDLGLRLLSWHGGQGDPIYAVGSSFLAGKGVPEELVRKAIRNMAANAVALKARSRERGEVMAVTKALQRLVRNQRSNPRRRNGPPRACRKKHSLMQGGIARFPVVVDGYGQVTVDAYPNGGYGVGGRGGTELPPRVARAAISVVAEHLAGHPSPVCPAGRSNPGGARGSTKRRAYVTSFCNKPHNVATGRPIGHECYVLPPKALEAEMRGDYATANEILGKMKRVVVKGRSNPPRVGIGRQRASEILRAALGAGAKLPSPGHFVRLRDGTEIHNDGSGRYRIEPSVREWSAKEFDRAFRAR